MSLAQQGASVNTILHNFALFCYNLCIRRKVIRYIKGFPSIYRCFVFGTTFTFRPGKCLFDVADQLISAFICFYLNLNIIFQPCSFLFVLCVAGNLLSAFQYHNAFNMNILQDKKIFCFQKQSMALHRNVVLPFNFLA